MLLYSVHKKLLKKQRLERKAEELMLTRDDENWMKHSLGYWENEKVRLAYRPVHMNTLDDEVESFPPKARVY
nr:unnamed protein product [Digitaria exilis]